MKSIAKWTSMLVIITLLLADSVRANDNNGYYPGNSDITYQQFYNELSPYGSWINDPQYGYVWSPYEAGFHPYRSNGNWAYTRYGWTWVSGYRWGWAPFHYGRWTMDPYYGWLWIPGYEWAPAWVDWRSGGDYYGWAPMGPGYGYNLSINIWNFVPSRYINSRRLHNYYVNPSRNVTIINNTTIINNNYGSNSNGYNGNRGPRRTYNAGPSVREVENATNVKVRQLEVVQSNNPGASSIEGRAVRIYKPAVEKTDSRSISMRPTKAIELNNIQQEELIELRRGTVQKSDLRAGLDNNSPIAQRNLNNTLKNVTESSPTLEASPFQDNGIKSNPVERRRFNNIRPEIDNSNPEINSSTPSRNLSEYPERVSRSRNADDVAPDRPAINSEMDRQIVPNQERGVRPVRQLSSEKNEIFSNEVPTINRPQARREFPQVQRELPAARQEFPERQSIQSRELSARRVAPSMEAPVRQEVIRGIPARENNNSREVESPRRIRRGE